MDEQSQEKKYRNFSFTVDWPAILDKYLFVRSQMAETAQVNSTPEQIGKIFARIGFAEETRRSDSIFDFTNQFVMAASETLPAFVIKASINHLGSLKEDGKYTVSEAHQATAINETMPILHPECILEWVKALDLRISPE